MLLPCWRVSRWSCFFFIPSGLLWFCSVLDVGGQESTKLFSLRTPGRLDWDKLSSAQSWPGLTKSVLLWLLLPEFLSLCAHTEQYSKAGATVLTLFLSAEVRTLWLDAVWHQRCSLLLQAQPWEMPEQWLCFYSGSGALRLGRKQSSRSLQCWWNACRGILHAQLPSCAICFLLLCRWTSHHTDLDCTDSQGAHLASVDGETFGLRNVLTTRSPTWFKKKKKEDLSEDDSQPLYQGMGSEPPESLPHRSQLGTLLRGFPLPYCSAVFKMRIQSFLTNLKF